MELEEENQINEKEGEIDYKEKCEKIIQYLQNKIIEFKEKIEELETDSIRKSMSGIKKLVGVDHKNEENE